MDGPRCNKDFGSDDNGKFVTDRSNHIHLKLFPILYMHTKYSPTARAYKTSAPQVGSCTCNVCM
jgi:hypothetical protein